MEGERGGGREGGGGREWIERELDEDTYSRLSLCSHAATHLKKYTKPTGPIPAFQCCTLKAERGPGNEAIQNLLGDTFNQDTLSCPY